MAELNKQDYEPGTHIDLAPPVSQVGITGWMRKNLFSTPTNVALTILTIYFLYKVIPPVLNWAFFDAVFSDLGHRNECREIAGGACWAVVRARLEQFIYGFYPEHLRWRVNLTFVLMFVALLPLLYDNVPKRKYLLWFSLIYPFLAFFMLWGGLGLEDVESAKMGGFMLTVLIGMTGIVVSLPLGIALSLGRHSSAPIIKVLSVWYIEFFRGVPLITLLFVASTLLNYFMPPGTHFDLLLRVIIMVILFAAAYIAEVIRGGLAAIPKGQFEAADALGLSYAKSMRLIILPQALKISIPGIVNTFIGLYKDTTLVVIVGLLDPLGISRATLADSSWQGLSTELYIFIALGFFISCFAMSRYSLYLERKLDTGHRVK